MADVHFLFRDRTKRLRAIVELLLLVCLRKLIDKEYPQPHTLKMVLREYSLFVDESGGNASLYNYPNALLRTAFEHLITLGLVHRTDNKKSPVLRDQVPPPPPASTPRRLSPPPASSNGTRARRA